VALAVTQAYEIRETNDSLWMVMNSIPRHPIVDTGPLFDFLLWQYSASSRMKTLLSKLKYLRNDSYQKSVSWYFSFAKPITTCPEVIAEIHRHAEEKLEHRNLGGFWRFAQGELKELRLSEELIELVRMDGETLFSHGPTDTALLNIALLSLSRDLNQPVFTVDRKLAGECRRKEVRVLDIAEVLSIWQQNGSK
jgi:hypothetical protein